MKKERRRLKKWMYDLLVSICVLLGTLACLVYSYFLETKRSTYLLARPDVYLALWLVILALLALLLLVRALRLRNTPEGEKEVLPIWGSANFLTVVLLVLYLLILERIGFLPASVLLLWILSYGYMRHFEKMGSTRLARIKAAFTCAVFALVSSEAVYLLFTRVLSVKLP